MLMINYLASIVDNFGNDTMARFVEAGLPVALLGVLTVFAVLSIIWGSLEVLKYFFYTLPEMKKKEVSQQESQSVSERAPVQSQGAYANDEEIVAAIIAAITAARADEGVPPSVPFRVVSFRKRK
ncbi:MAG: OadG family protein [Clostridia bacterium]|nr:OadG family protein [Clostridia bacterium]